jgi:hypothetical protein
MRGNSLAPRAACAAVERRARRSGLVSGHAHRVLRLRFNGIRTNDAATIEAAHVVAPGSRLRGGSRTGGDRRRDSRNRHPAPIRQMKPPELRPVPHNQPRQEEARSLGASTSSCRSREHGADDSVTVALPLSANASHAHSATKTSVSTPVATSSPEIQSRRSTPFTKRATTSRQKGPSRDRGDILKRIQMSPCDRQISLRPSGETIAAVLRPSGRCRLVTAPLVRRARSR